MSLDDSSEQALAPLRELAALAQTGLAFTKDKFDQERYTRIRELVEGLLRGPLASNPDFDPSVLVGREEGYTTPKVDVRGAAFRDGRVLMVRERSDGLWTLPGGWADVNQSPSEAIVKEIREESGFEAQVVKVAAFLDKRKHPHPPVFHHAYKVFFLCELTGGAAGTSIETDAVDFFAEDALPPLSVQRVTAGQLALMFRHQRDRSLPTDFD
ncbi:MAG: NUDIX hydrolase N-terminal domain-containing protein [Gammaproteobacteria bacterium]